MSQTSLDYLDICALKHKIEDRDDPKKLLFLALKLELQTQATHYLERVLETESFATICEKSMPFEDAT